MDRSKKREDRILAFGEVTGHAHRVTGGVVYDDPDYESGRYMDVAEEATVMHEEHQPMTLPAGEYRTGVVREMDHLQDAIREVQD